MRYVFLFLGMSVCFASSYAVTNRNGFAENPNATNQALLVGVAYSLPGIDLDIKNVDEMLKDPAYRFSTKVIRDNEGTVENVLQSLKSLSASIKDSGTLLFYFSGHGGIGDIALANDLSATPTQIRDAITAGRAGLPPLERLVLMYDSCHAGSMVDPMRKGLSFFDSLSLSNAMADQLAETFSGNRAEAYWKKLFVFAASRAEETSGAMANGSIFTLAMQQAYKEVSQSNGTISEFVDLTKRYSFGGQHPVERLVPTSLYQEKLR